jgi:hypothetical protein
VGHDEATTGSALQSSGIPRLLTRLRQVKTPTAMQSTLENGTFANAQLRRCRAHAYARACAAIPWRLAPSTEQPVLPVYASRDQITGHKSL